MPAVCIGESCNGIGLGTGPGHRYRQDQGQSGKRAEHRSGFQRLLAEVTLGRVGLVLGLEMSRLARSCKDWYHLLEVCSVVSTLLGDQDGVYDPHDGNDRLLLGLKGTMSEIELVTMKQRMERGRLNKAERGELFSDPPVGYVKLPTGELVLDPDEQLRDSVKLVFDVFAREGTAYAVMRYFRKHNLPLGRRERCGPKRGQVIWGTPTLATLWNMLGHPFYAGAYAYGRKVIDRQSLATGRRRAKTIRPSIEDWAVLKRDHLPAYISWEQFMANRQRLQSNRLSAKSGGAPRNGSSLLTGLAVCGACGWRMRTTKAGAGKGYYICVRNLQTGTPRTCRGVPASCLDPLITEQLLKAIEPAALDVSLQACRSVEDERQKLLRLGRQRVERAKFEAERAARQYAAVEPENRLVARSLEAQWEASLIALRQAEAEYKQLERSQPATLSIAEQERIRALATDLPSLWHSSATRPEDRKAILRCLIEKVVVHIPSENENIRVVIQWRGGITSEHKAVRPILEYRRLEGYADLRSKLTDWRKAGLTTRQIASRLNAEGIRPIKRAEQFAPQQCGNCSPDGECFSIRTLTVHWRWMNGCCQTCCELSAWMGVSFVRGFGAVGFTPDKHPARNSGLFGQTPKNCKG
jgi:DNA invertase Pin-like site-specific DNA recombinase